MPFSNVFFCNFLSRVFRASIHLETIFGIRQRSSFLFLRIASHVPVTIDRPIDLRCHLRQISHFRIFMDLLGTSRSDPLVCLFVSVVKSHLKNILIVQAPYFPLPDPKLP